jgi:glucose/arabinose dehydrogenase
MSSMIDRAAPIPRRSDSRRARGRAPAFLGGTLLIAALLAPGSTAAVRPPQAEPAVAAPEGSSAEPGAVVLGGPTTADIALDQRVGSLNSPVFITSARDGTDRFFIVEQTGRIKIWVPGSGVRNKPFLSLAGKVSLAFERGLLGLAFHPNYESNRKLYVYFTRPDGDIVIREYKARASKPNRVNPDSKRMLLRIEHSANTNHNGGMLAFGPDGNLYFGTGDGGSQDDPNNRGQRIDTLLGKMLRINVNGRTGNKAYGIPSSNPYVGEPGENEIWQRGLRNPWRFSFDSANGNLWIADVGQRKWEEIDRAIDTASGPGRGINWGWRVLEGTHCFIPSSGCNTSGKTMPVTEYEHTAGNGRCSVTGGYVYRGSGIPDLVGGYVFADYCTGEIFVISASASNGVNPALLLNTPHNISSFGERPNGELFVVAHGGRVYQIVPG